LKLIPLKLIPNFAIIYGGGKYGQMAIDFLKDHHQILIIDLNIHVIENHIGEQVGEEELMQLIPLFSAQKSFSIYKIIGGIDLLAQIIKKFIPDVLIPVAPIHIMLDLIKTLIRSVPNSRKSNLVSVVENKSQIKEYFPNVNNLNIGLSKNTIYFSYAPEGLICPDKCPGPENFCPYHKVKKPVTIKAYVNDLKFSTPVILFESKQIAPGIGGIFGQDIIKILKKIDLNSVSDCIYIATACNCHGVLNALKISN
jgi:hypothetical protein